MFSRQRVVVLVGLADGTKVGFVEGVLLGKDVCGNCVGLVGFEDGFEVGMVDGKELGDKLGSLDGISDG